MKLTKGVVSHTEAFNIAPDYVSYIDGDYDIFFNSVMPKFDTLRVGHKVLTCHEGVYVLARVSSRNTIQNFEADGPIVRVSNGEYSWRVDGSAYAYPIPA
jgi:hypothetical protein